MKYLRNLFVPIMIGNHVKSPTTEQLIFCAWAYKHTVAQTFFGLLMLKHFASPKSIRLCFKLMDEDYAKNYGKSSNSYLMHGIAPTHPEFIAEWEDLIPRNQWLDHDNPTNPDNHYFADDDPYHSPEWLNRNEQSTAEDGEIINLGEAMIDIDQTTYCEVCGIDYPVDSPCILH